MLDEPLTLPKKKRTSKHVFRGSRNASAPAAANPSQRIPAKKHVNGGGWVADTAQVDSSVYVSPNSEVWGNAVIKGFVKLKGRCTVCDSALIEGNVTLSGSVVVCDRAKIIGHAVIKGVVEVKNNASIYGTTSINGDVVVKDSAVLHSATISGWGQICNDAAVFNTSLTGDFAITNHAILNVATLDGRYCIGGTTTVASSTLINRGARVTYFYRTKIRRSGLGRVNPIYAASNHNLQYSDTAFTSLEQGEETRYTFICRGRSAITNSNLYGPAHILSNVVMQNITGRFDMSNIVVIPQPLALLSDVNLTTNSLISLQRETPNNRGVRTNTIRTSPQQTAAQTQPARSAHNIIDPRGARILRTN